MSGSKHKALYCKKKKLWTVNVHVHITNSQKLRLNCIEQAYLCCLPSILIPDTVCLNSMGLQKDSIGHFHYTFDLLPDVSFGQLKERLKVYCLYDNYPSQTCEIEWRLDLQDLGWISKFLFLFFKHRNYTWITMHVSFNRWFLVDLNP